MIDLKSDEQPGEDGEFVDDTADRNTRRFFEIIGLENVVHASGPGSAAAEPEAHVRLVR